MNNFRDENGRFVQKECTDPNCSGKLQRNTHWDGTPVFTCDGLTFEDDNGPLIACDREVRAFETTDDFRKRMRLAA